MAIRCNHTVHFLQSDPDSDEIIQTTATGNPKGLLVYIAHSSVAGTISGKLGLTQTGFVCRYDTGLVPWRLQPNDMIQWLSGPYEDMEGNQITVPVTNVVPKFTTGESVATFEIAGI